MTRTFPFPAALQDVQLEGSSTLSSADDEDVPEHDKYVFCCETDEEKKAWEDVIREQIWKASTTNKSVQKERRVTGFHAPKAEHAPMTMGDTIGEEDEEEMED